MLRNEVNKHIQNNDLEKAYSIIDSYLGKGKNSSPINKGLKEKLEIFKDNHLIKLINPSEQTITDLAARLQDLAVEVETTRVVTYVSIRKKMLAIATLIISILGFLISTFFPPLYEEYIATHQFTDNNKTHLIIYDFDQYSDGGNYDLEDLLHNGISSKNENNFWHKYFESNRKVGTKIFDKDWIYSKNYKVFNRILKETTNRKIKADVALTGILKKNGKEITLQLDAHCNDTDTVSTHIINNINNSNHFTQNPCALFPLVDLIDIEKPDFVERIIDDLKDDIELCNKKYKKKYVNKVVELGLKAIQFQLNKTKEKSKNSKESNEDSFWSSIKAKVGFLSSKETNNTSNPNNSPSIYQDSTASKLGSFLYVSIDGKLFPDIKAKVCYQLQALLDESKYDCSQYPKGPLYDLYTELNMEINTSMAEIYFHSNKNRDSEKDYIELVAFFNLNSDAYLDSLITFNQFEKWSKILVQKKYYNKFKLIGKGHSCDKGDNPIRNDEVSEERIERIVKDLKLSQHNISITSVSDKEPHPFEVSEGEDHRRATIHFFDKEKPKEKPQSSQQLASKGGLNN